MKEILRSLRNKNNYSQSAVAEYLEISRQMYNKYESGTAERRTSNHLYGYEKQGVAR